MNTHNALIFSITHERPHILEEVSNIPHKTPDIVGETYSIPGLGVIFGRSGYFRIHGKIIEDQMVYNF